jgi:hypothetical protein
MAKFRVFQFGLLDDEAIAFEYDYPVEASSEEEAVDLIIEDKEIINDDFINCPENGVTWLGNGYAKPMILMTHKEVGA